MAADTSLSGPSLPWKVIARALGFQSQDHELWWLNAAPMLNRLMEECDYGIHLQYKYLLFFYHYVIPVLGPFFPPGTVPNYISRLTKHGHPLDMSINFQETGGMVRITFGVVGSFAGLQRDPLNQFKTREFLNALTPIDRSISLQWFNHFESEFFIDHRDIQMVTSTLPKVDWATKMLSADMKKNGDMVLKAYYMIRPKSVVTGLPTSTLIFNAIQHLGPAFNSGLSLMKQFFSTSHEAKPLDMGLLGFDCLDPELSRIKLYASNNDGTFDSIRRFWTLDGALNDDMITRGLSILERICDLMQFRWSTASRSLPIMFNYEIKQWSTPKPQIYLPLLDRNDQFDSERLRAVFQDLQWKNVPVYENKEKGVAQLL
ncbi:aromatic prenyltransferase [Aspergillus ambiguus]|uniref:aromatic prenyltransferase n=1 Tax=Aspergillus ambiguus TaxID=176160 RepID=UPI003CCE2221